MTRETGTHSTGPTVTNEPRVGEAHDKKRRRNNERNSAAYDDEIFELLQSIDAWRRKNSRAFPAWSEVLQILKSLGWRKVAPAEPLAVAKAIAAKPAPVEPLLPTARS